MITPSMLIIADDLTGAADCAAACARCGVYSSVLLELPKSREEAAELETVGVLSIDADTRGLRPEQATDAIEKLLYGLDAMLAGLRSYAPLQESGLDTARQHCRRDCCDS